MRLRRGGKETGAVYLLFAATIFLSAGLLFCVQPMIAKAVLPLLGGSPSVWNTCMLFFQATLLAGYGYAHFSSKWLSVRQQTIGQVLLFVAAVCLLPISISERWINSVSGMTHPSLWLLGCLAMTVGLPFFALSSNTPLLQKWFSMTPHPAARDPYFLYSASNCGSLLALLAYPVLMEPALKMRDQSLVWAGGFLLLIGLIAFCAVIMWRLKSQPAETARRGSEHEKVLPASRRQEERGNSSPPLPAGRTAALSPNQERLLWIVLAFVPCSLTLGATQFLATDIASIPLFWIVPLAIYLATFALAFARKPVFPVQKLGRTLPYAAIALVFLMLIKATEPILLLMGLHLLFLFLAATACHGRLAALRPPTDRLTEFYFLISLGGVLGGIFNALIAPNVFTSLAEYPIAIVLACALGAGVSVRKPMAVRMGWALLITAPVLLAGMGALFHRAGVEGGPLRDAIVVGTPLVLVFLLAARPAHFAAGLALLLFASPILSPARDGTVHVERNFFGVSRVADSAGERRMYHGSTLHGRQFTDAQRRCEPLAYYHRNGPLGKIIELYQANGSQPHVAVVGLGSGSMAAYSRAHELWTFFEIDPAVIRIAQDTNYFTYLQQCAATRVNIVQGDARLRLREARDGGFGLLVLDAFSSDAIPVHLMTREAIELYLSKMSEDGLLAFHISNRYLELESVLADLAAHFQLTMFSARDFPSMAQQTAEGRETSHWVVMARMPKTLSGLESDRRWLPLKGNPGRKVWTDDFSNILSVFRS